MIGNDALAMALYRDGGPSRLNDQYGDAVKRAIALKLLGQKDEPAPQGGGMSMPGMDSLPGLGETMNAGGGGGGGFNGSPWDAAFSAIGPIHGALEGNDPNTPFVPKNRTPHGSDNALIGAGGLIGSGVGSIFGLPGAGRMAGQNVGATFSDIAHGDINNLGSDVSANLPPIPGMQQPGWKGLLNGATGLPFGTLFGKIFG